MEGISRLKGDGTFRGLYTRYDRDNDGRLNEDELNSLLRDADIGNSWTRGAWVRGILDRFDLGGDRTISWDELEKAIESYN